MKKMQLVMVWLLPVILIGGLFYPILGYLVLAMMAFLLTMSFFKGRYWCSHLCPIGAFLDLAVSKISRNKPLPKIFTKNWFRWLVFFIFIGFLVWRLLDMGADLVFIGMVFVGMCILTTIISVILGFITKHRGWCAICPMGTLQEKIYKMRKGKKNLNE